MEKKLERRALPGLSPTEADQMRRTFSDPLSVPQEFKQWLVSYLESNPPILPANQMLGYSSGADRLLAYDEVTTNVAVSHTTEATADVVIQGTTELDLDGNTGIVVEFYAPNIVFASGGALFTGVLMNASTVIAQIGIVGGAGTSPGSFYFVYRATPAAGTYEFSLAGFNSASTSSVKAGASGSGNFGPAYLRITKDI